MVTGLPFRQLFVGILVAAMPVPAMAVAVSAPLPITDAPAGVAPEAVEPVSRAAAGSVPELAQPSVFLAEAPEVAPYRPMGPPVFAGLSILEIVLIGGVLMAVVIFARRRHRRRIGWGVIPERSFGWMRRAG